MPSLLAFPPTVSTNSEAWHAIKPEPAAQYQFPEARLQQGDMLLRTAQKYLRSRAGHGPRSRDCRGLPAGDIRIRLSLLCPFPRHKYRDRWDWGGIQDVYIKKVLTKSTIPFFWIWSVHVSISLLLALDDTRKEK